jgi:hypothetical protein
MRKHKMTSEGVRRLFIVWDQVRDEPMTLSTKNRELARIWRRNLRRTCCGPRCNRYVVRNLILGGIINRF